MCARRRGALLWMCRLPPASRSTRAASAAAAGGPGCPPTSPVPRVDEAGAAAAAAAAQLHGHWVAAAHRLLPGQRGGGACGGGRWGTGGLTGLLATRCEQA